MSSYRQDESGIYDMTHSLYRIGDKAWGDDWVVVARAARGVNDAGATARLQSFLELARASGAANWGHGRGGGRLNNDWTTMVARLADTATVTVVFDDVGYLEGFLDQLHAMDLKLSITVSGDMARIKEICTRRGWKPHSGRQALGVFGGQESLPPYEVLCVRAQCGHGLIATHLIEEIVEHVRTGDCSPEEAAEKVGRPCVCGLLNSSRTAALLRYLASQPPYPTGAPAS
jgi:hypothetical protein